jgi:NADP-dependent 3-hydroxy acid dehydrogenase YdfG
LFQAIAKSFAAANARAIILVGRDEAALQEAATEIHSMAADVETRIEKVTICDANGVQDMFGRVQKQYGYIDVLVNNAGSGSG